MEYDIFLEENDRLKLNILRQILFATQHRLPITELIKQLHVSKYKLNKLMMGLIRDIDQAEGATSVVIKDDEMVGDQISYRSLRELQLMYVKNSLLFRVFQYEHLQKKQLSRYKFLEDNFISQAQYYNQRAKIDSITTELGLFSPERTIVNHPEFITRLGLTDLYYYFYNGIEDPFKELKGITSKLVNLVTMTFFLLLSPMQVSKLRLFFQLQVMRIQNGQVMTDFSGFVRSLATEPAEIIAKFYENNLNIKDSRLIVNEVNYLFVFLQSQELVEKLIMELAPENELKLRRVTQMFIKFVEKSASIDEATLPSEIANDSDRILTTLNRRILVFDISSSEVISQGQLRHFQALYPGCKLIPETTFKRAYNE